MSNFSAKVYVVQQADGEVIGTKLTFEAAHRLALKYAPAKVLFSIADKSDEPNVTAHELSQRRG